MNFKLLILSFFVVFVSCKEEAPVEVLPENKTFTDFIIADKKPNKEYRITEYYSEDLNINNDSVVKFDLDSVFEVEDEEPLEIKKVNFSRTNTDFKIGEFNIKTFWVRNLAADTSITNRNEGYKIKKMMIYQNGNLLQVFKKFDNDYGIGELPVGFHDYNLDGFMDISMLSYDRMGCCAYENFYFFNSINNSFDYEEEWNSIRIAKLDKNKMILETTLFSRCYCENYKKVYLIRGTKLKQLKEIRYSNCDDLMLPELKQN